MTRNPSTTVLRSSVGISWKLIVRVFLSLVVASTFLAAGLLLSCGPFTERYIKECPIIDESAAISSKTERVASFQSKHYCSKIWEFLDRFPVAPSAQRKALSEAPSCRQPVTAADARGGKSRSLHPLQKLFKRKPHTEKSKSLNDALQDFPYSFTQPIVLTESNQQLIRALSRRVRDNIPKFISRAALVSWGGPGGPKWYYPVGEHHSLGRSTGSVVAVDNLDGGLLLYSYLRIMKWPKDLRIFLPAQLCSKGCDAEVSLAHTLEFREKYKPWFITPAAIYENRDGFVYHRGFSLSMSNNQEGRHSLVWFRPGTHKREDSLAFLRAMLYTLERAIADSLRMSGHRVGKYNVVIDTQGFSFSMIPKISEVKLGLKVLQDHLPDRLGMVFIVNLSHPAELAFNLVKPFLSREVRNKIRVVPNNHEKKWAMLRTVVEPEYIPKWLGGLDDYKFDPDTYYPRYLRISNQQGLEYIQTMPYHAY